MSDLKSLNRRFYDEVLNKGNLDVVDELVDEDMVEHVPLPGQAPGREGLKEAIKMLRVAFPDLHFEIHAELEEGELVAAVSTMTGTHQGEFMGMPPSGNTFSTLSLDVSRIRNGKLVEHWGLIDNADVTEQLGVPPDA